MTEKPKRARATTPKPPAEKVTLRDQLAMAALQGPLAGESHYRREQLVKDAYESHYRREQLVKDAYLIADLMLVARAAGGAA